MVLFTKDICSIICSSLFTKYEVTFDFFEKLYKRGTINYDICHYVIFVFEFIIDVNFGGVLFLASVKN